LLHALIEKGHADDALDLLVHGSHVIREHAARAQPIQHDRAIVAGQLGVNQVAAGTHPIVVADKRPLGHFGHAVLGHIDRDRLVAAPRQRLAQDHRHLPSIGAHAVEQDDLHLRLRVAVGVEMDVVAIPVPPFLGWLLPRFPLELGREELLHVAPDGLVCVGHGNSGCLGWVGRIGFFGMCRRNQCARQAKGEQRHSGSA
jgi:hypothetical protein